MCTRCVSLESWFSYLVRYFFMTLLGVSNSFSNIWPSFFLIFDLHWNAKKFNVNLISDLHRDLFEKYFNKLRPCFFLVLVQTDLLPILRRVKSAYHSCDHPWKENFGLNISGSIRLDLRRCVDKKIHLTWPVKIIYISP